MSEDKSMITAFLTAPTNTKCESMITAFVIK